MEAFMELLRSALPNANVTMKHTTATQRKERLEAAEILPRQSHITPLGQGVLYQQQVKK